MVARRRSRRAPLDSVADSSSQILGEYDRDRSLYEDLTITTQRLVEQLLAYHEIRVHGVFRRTKKRDSLERNSLNPNVATRASLT